ncbi:hypothetical protein SAMN05216388_1017111 [Halorientalis persicus]|uniref:DUF8009 domain-containing protein n=1 Tax=Halorientalis persicus TaxID=1367881 RepID=A0A1H8S222_9EURY|nr:hypothetical protein [Halorientalis persicus]SEO72388.1 hypothetical protein SAMN05216388_1017111 [Halorientalis persicus]
MAQQIATTDGGSDENHPAADLETIVVDPEAVVETMRRTKRDETEQRSHVLRVSPPFEGEQTATTHVSEDHAHYPPEMDPKPLHIGAVAFLVGHDEGSRHPKFRNEWSYPDISEVRSIYRDDVPEDEQDDEAWDEWWDTAVEMWEGRVRHALQKTDEITLTSQHPDIEATTVAVRFESDE